MLLAISLFVILITDDTYYSDILQHYYYTCSLILNSIDTIYYSDILEYYYYTCSLMLTAIDATYYSAFL